MEKPKVYYPAFDINDFVYLKTDPDQERRQVLRITIDPNGFSYELACGNVVSWHYDIEMSYTKDYGI